MTEDRPADSPGTTVGFDTHDPDIAIDPFPTYARLRAGSPVTWTDAWGGYWISAGHAEVAKAARSPLLTTGQVRADGVMQGVSTPPPGHTGRMIPLELDVPQCLKYRKLLAAFYSPTRVTEREPELRALAKSCVDSVVHDGAADLVRALTLRLPAILAMRDIGLPESAWSDIESELHRAMLSTPHDPDSAREAAQQVCLHIIDAMELERGAGDTALIGQLLRSEIDGAPVAPPDIVSMMYLLLLGIDPTSTLTATALWHLGRNPDLRATLVRDPTRIAAVTDEFVRWVSPVQGTFRTMKADDVIGGQRVCAGDRVLLSWASGNRDETVFDRPDDIILGRDASKHVAFGGGPHYCLGAAMVRSMFTVMIAEVLTRIPDYEVVEEQVDWFPDLSSVYGIRALPVRFRAAGREDAGVR